MVLLLSVTCLMVSMVTGAKAAPIPLEMVDMSHPFDETTLNWPGQQEFKLVVTHNETAEEGYWLQMDEFFSGIHVGTHMDAPCHFAKGHWCVDKIPISHFTAPAAVIDITSSAKEDPDATVEVADLENWEQMSGQSLDGTIVVIRSGWGAYWSNWTAYTGTPDNDTTKFHFPGMSEKTAKWLADNRSIYGVATETLSVDNGASSGDLMAHRTLLPKNIYFLENVANIGELPIYGATIHAYPLKITNASGAPTRIIATFPKVKFTGDGGGGGKPITEGSLREIIIFS